jgi:hypothetical protein
MNYEQIQGQFRASVCESVSLKPEGQGRFRVFAPFQFDDGDHLCIVLKGGPGAWVLSDEGHTFMHLSYELDVAVLAEGSRRQSIESALALHGLQETDGELALKVQEDRLGDALLSFVQGLLKVASVAAQMPRGGATA